MKLKGFSIVDADGKTVAYIISKDELATVASLLTAQPIKRRKRRKKSAAKIKREKLAKYQRDYRARKQDEEAKKAKMQQIKKLLRKKPKKLHVTITKTNAPIAAKSS